MMQCERRVGRLCEVSARPPFTVDEADTQFMRVRLLVTSSKQPLVFCSDVRAVTVLPPDVADKMVALMRADNARIERHAFLVAAESSLFAMQVERMLRDSTSPARRSFRDPGALAAWLGEVLTPEEARRLDEFLGR